MVQNPPEGYQRVIPYLIYNDAPSAIDFLCKAFGFTEKFRMPMPDGKIGHAELSYDNNVVMLATAVAEMNLVSPANLPAKHAGVGVYVDDVDAHFEQAKVAGAVIIAEPEDQFYGDRMYRAQDPEGHNWSLHTHIRDVPLDEMIPPSDC